jgi:hypothetical protein
MAGLDLTRMPGVAVRTIVGCGPDLNSTAVAVARATGGTASAAGPVLVSCPDSPELARKAAILMMINKATNKAMLMSVRRANDLVPPPYNQPSTAEVKRFSSNDPKNCAGPELRL